MLRDSSHYPYQNVFVPDELAGRWRSSCSAGGIVGWYFSSATAPLEKLVSVQDSEGYGSDAHNPELLMAIAAARHFETNPERRRRLSARPDQLASHLNPDCAAVSHPARAFNWQNRNPEFTWLLTTSNHITYRMQSRCYPFTPSRHRTRGRRGPRRSSTR